MYENRARLAIVVPCYNEEEVIEMSNSVLVEKLKELMDEGLISDDSYIYYVNEYKKRGWDIYIYCMEQLNKNLDDVVAEICKLAKEGNK